MSKSSMPLIIVAIAIICLGVYLSGTDLSGLGGASLLGTSSVTDENGVTYWVVPITQQNIQQEKVLSSTKTSKVTGTTTSGNVGSGTITGDFKIDVQSLGWETPLSVATTDKIILSINDTDRSDSFWDVEETELEYKWSNTGIKYYTPNKNTWTPDAQYTVSVTINGETYSQVVNTEAATGTRITVYDGDSEHSPIYYEEAGNLYGSSTETSPDNVYGKQFVLIGNEVKMTQISDFVKTANAKIYSRNMGGTVIYEYYPLYDFTNDGKIENFPDYYDDKRITLGESWYKTASPATLGYDASQFTIKNPSGTANLVYETPINILGVWYIPIEYGDITVTKTNSIPEFTGATISGELYDSGTATLTATIKNTGSTGGITMEVQPSSTNGKYLTFSPQTVTKEVAAGQEGTFTMTLGSSDISGDYTGSVTLLATGQSGQTDTYTLSYTIKDKAAVASSDLVEITIVTVDENGATLTGGYPIIVSQTNTEGKDSLTLTVAKGTIEVTGRSIDERVPVSMEINANKDGETFYLVYQPEGYSESNALFYAIIGILSLVVVALLAVVYLTPSKGKKKR